MVKITDSLLRDWWGFYLESILQIKFWMWALILIFIIIDGFLFGIVSALLILFSSVVIAGVYCLAEVRQQRFFKKHGL